MNADDFVTLQQAIEYIVFRDFEFHGAELVLANKEKLNDAEELLWQAAIMNDCFSFYRERDGRYIEAGVPSFESNAFLGFGVYRDMFHRRDDEFKNVLFCKGDLRQHFPQKQSDRKYKLVYEEIQGRNPKARLCIDDGYIKICIHATSQIEAKQNKCIKFLLQHPNEVIDARDLVDNGIFAPNDLHATRLDQIIPAVFKGNETIMHVCFPEFSGNSAKCIPEFCDTDIESQ